MRSVGALESGCSSLGCRVWQDGVDACFIVCVVVVRLQSKY